MSHGEVYVRQRGSVSMKNLQENIMMNMLDTGNIPEIDDEDEEFMPIYLEENNQNQFDRCVLDVLSQIANYLKL